MDERLEILRYRRVAYKVLVGKSEGEKIFGKPTLVWNDPIMDFRKICWK